MYAEDGSRSIRSEQPRILFLTLPFSEELIKSPQKADAGESTLQP